MAVHVCWCAHGHVPRMQVPDYTCGRPVSAESQAVGEHTLERCFTLTADSRQERAAGVSDTPESAVERQNGAAASRTASSNVSLHPKVPASPLSLIIQRASPFTTSLFSTVVVAFLSYTCLYVIVEILLRYQGKVGGSTPSRGTQSFLGLARYVRRRRGRLRRRRRWVW